MITFLKKVSVWLAYSSVNAEKISLTFKGIATLLVPIVLYIANAYSLKLDNETVTRIIDATSSSIILLGGMIGTIMTTIGALRKIISTIRGTNEVIASFRK